MVGPVLPGSVGGRSPRRPRWTRPDDGRGHHVDLVERQEGRIDIEERLLLSLGEAGIAENGELDRPTYAVIRAEDSRPDVELLRGDPQRLGDLLQHLGRGLAETTLDLAQVRVGDAGLLGELPQGETRLRALLLEVVAQRPTVFPTLPFTIPPVC